MEPRIQYAKTSDGVNIAYAVFGDGPPIVLVPNPPWSHIQLAWQNPDARTALERAATQQKLIQYDGRGSGLSQRRVNDFSLEAHVRDLEAVVDQLQLDRLALFGTLAGGPIAIAYCALHPERISHLILWCSLSRAIDLNEAPQAKALIALVDQDWQLFTETVAHVATGWSAGEETRRNALFMRECVDEEQGRAIIRATLDFDASSFLPRVAAKTLVLHGRQVPYPPLETAQELTEQIPDSQLMVIEGGLVMGGGIFARLDDLGRQFILGSARTESPAPKIPSGTAIIFFTDIVDSTALTERLGDAAFRAKARELGPALRGLVRDCGGTTVEGPTLGDGLLATFASAREAIEAARRCGKAGDDAGLPLHLGLHAGDVTREKDPDGRDNVYGGAVNIASRISGLSAPGEVLVSDTVRSLARTSAGVVFEDRGEQALKGIDDAVRVWAVREG